MIGRWCTGPVPALEGLNDGHGCGTGWTETGRVCRFIGVTGPIGSEFGYFAGQPFTGLRQVILACGFGEESVVADAARSRSGTGQDPSVGGAERTALTSPVKTQVGNCMEKGHGFEFLGYRFEAGRRGVRPKSRKALRDKIRQKTGRTRSGSLETIISELNPILKGWLGYFQHAHRSTFRDVEHGLFTLHEAHVLASQSRRGNYRLEICVRGGRVSFQTPINLG